MIKVFRLHEDQNLEFIGSSESAKYQHEASVQRIINGYLKSLGYSHYQYSAEVGTTCTGWCWNFENFEDKDFMPWDYNCDYAYTINFVLEYSGPAILTLLGLSKSFVNCGVPMN